MSPLVASAAPVYRQKFRTVTAEKKMTRRVLNLLEQKIIIGQMVLFKENRF